MNKPYWLRMQFGPEVVAIVREALKAKLWRGLPLERLEKLRVLNRRMSEHYGVPTCSISIQNTLIGPHYRPGDDAIVLDKVSLVSWAHEFGHHLLHCRQKPQQEVYPRSFSLSLFYRAAPRMFETARADGRLLYTEGEANAQ